MQLISLRQNKAIGDKPRRERNPDRIGELATLPVFCKLAGRKVVLAGGSEAAAWKAELLSACGAIVHIYAEQLCEGFDALINEKPKGFIHHQRPWCRRSFDGAAIAVGDVGSEGEAKAFYCAAVTSGVAVNVIDRPAYCQFQFGSIVNRGPVVVGISTDGAAPILGQAIRRRIETVLPPLLRGWAKLAKRIRPVINETLPTGRDRRLFWERFADQAFSGTEAKLEDVSHLLERTHNQDVGDRGKVTLVGAGPGDAELLTVKAVRALQAADIILFDDLVSDDVLELSRREAKRMLVGKRGGRDSCKQDDINQMMLKLARSGKNVVRLKSGDPTIFGRAGEEIAFLERADIAVSIIPGVTAATAMAAELNVSLTHRDHAQSVRFVTGHSRLGTIPEDMGWAGIADARTTTVFYMGGRMARKISDRLIKHGLPRSTPASIVSAVSKNTRQEWHGSVERIPEGINEIGYDQPVLIAVGECLRQDDRDFVSRTGQPWQHLHSQKIRGWESQVSL